MVVINSLAYCLNSSETFSSALIRDMLLPPPEPFFCSQAVVFLFHLEKDQRCKH